MRPEKEAMVQEVSRQVASSRAILLANYMGLKAHELEEFRNILKPLSSDCMIVKNTLLSRVLANASLPAMQEHLSGPTAIIFGSGDDVVLARRVMQFVKEHEPLKIKAGILEKNAVGKELIAHLATLPGREVLIGRVVGTLKAPLSNLVGILSAVPRGLVVALAEILKQREEAVKQ